MSRAPDLTSADFLASAQGLLPSGPAWPRDADATLTQFWLAVADRFQTLHLRCRDLIEREADPARTAEALTDWERAWGLPDECSPNSTFSRASVATFFDADGVLQIAPVDQLRYLYDAVTGAQADPLIETAATNLVLSSGVITTASPWSFGSQASDLGAVAGPDGLLTARRCGSISGTGANAYLGFDSRLTLLPNTTYTISAYFKRGAGASLAGRFLTFDEYNPALTPTRTTGLAIATANVGASWERVQRTFTTRSDTTSIQVYWLDGHTTGNAWDMALAQLEANGAASSFIYTTTVPVTRAADLYFLRSLQERQAALVAKIGARGGQSVQYFIAVAAALGFAITIEEFRPFRADRSTADDPLNNPPWPFTWRVHAPAQSLFYFRADRSTAGDRISAASNQSLECVFGRLKPAHTTVLFSYGS